jgi:hypothetical protein
MVTMPIMMLYFLILDHATWLDTIAKSDAFNVDLSEEQDTLNMIQKGVSNASDRLYIHLNWWAITTLETFISAQAYELQRTKQSRLPTVSGTCKNSDTQDGSRGDKWVEHSGSRRWSHWKTSAPEVDSDRNSPAPAYDDDEYLVIKTSYGEKYRISSRTISELCTGLTWPQPFQLKQRRSWHPNMALSYQKRRKYSTMHVASWPKSDTHT